MRHWPRRTYGRLAAGRGNFLHVVVAELRLAGRVARQNLDQSSAIWQLASSRTRPGQRGGAREVKRACERRLQRSAGRTPCLCDRRERRQLRRSWLRFDSGRECRWSSQSEAEIVRRRSHGVVVFGGTQTCDGDPAACASGATLRIVVSAPCVASTRLLVLRST